LDKSDFGFWITAVQNNLKTAFWTRKNPYFAGFSSSFENEVPLDISDAVQDIRVS